MVEAYSVASRLTMTTNASQVIAKLLSGFGQLDAALKSTQGNVGRLSAELRTLSGGSRGIGATTRALEKLGTFRMGGGVLGDMDKITLASRELATIQAQLARAAAETAASYRAMAAASASVRTPPMPGAPRPAAGGSGPNQPPAPAGPAPAVRGTSHVGVLNTAMGLQTAGDSGWSLFTKAIKAEMDVSQQLASLRMNTGVTDADIAEARKMAERITKETPGTTIAGNLHHLVDAFTVMGTFKDALAGTPALAKMAYVLANIPGAKKGDTSFANMQAVEVMQRHVDPVTHKVDMAALNQQLAAMTQVAVGTGGRVDGPAYLGFAKQSRVGGMVANDKYLYEDLPAILIALGGQRAGTGDAAVWNQFVTGKMTKNAFTALQKSGLLGEGAKWKGGQVLDMSKHLKGFELLGQNRVEWTRQHMLGPTGALANNGIDPTNKMAVANFLSSWASRQTGLGYFAEMTLGMDAINKERDKIRTTTTTPMQVLEQHDPMQKIREFRAAENELFVTLGKDAMGPALEALRGLTQVLRDLSAWGKEHPNAARDLTLIVGGLSALTYAVGTLAAIVFVGAPLIGGLNALATALLPFGAGGVALGALVSLGAGLFGLVGPLIAAGAAVAGLVFLLGKVHTPDAAATGQVEQNRQQRERGSRDPMLGAPQDGFGVAPTAPPPSRPSNGLLQPSSWLAPPSSAAQVQPVVLHVDGREMGRALIPHLGRQLDGPPTGRTSFDPTLAPRYGGAAFNT